MEVVEEVVQGVAVVDVVDLMFRVRRDMEEKGREWA